MTAGVANAADKFVDPRGYPHGPMAREIGRYKGLYRSDKGVILLRKVWARELKALAEGRKLTQWQHRADLLASFAAKEAGGAPQPAV